MSKHSDRNTKDVLQGFNLLYEMHRAREMHLKTKDYAVKRGILNQPTTMLKKDRD